MTNGSATSSVRPANGPAVASFLCGLLSCLGFTAPLAVLFALFALRRARLNQSRGKSLAVTGLALGLIWLCIYGYASYTAYQWYQLGPRTVAFLKAVRAGDYASARAYTTASVTDGDLHSLHDQIQSLGHLHQPRVESWRFSRANGQTTLHLTGTATFAGGSRRFTATLIRDSGSVKIDRFQLE